MTKNIKIILMLLLMALPVSRAQDYNKTDNFNLNSPDSLNNRGKNFWGIGLVLGSPASISLTTGIYFQHISFRITGGAWSSHWYGIQGEIAFPFTRSKELIQNISINGGLIATKVLFSDPNQSSVQYYQYNKQNYIGFTYDVWYSGFLMQTGIGFGKGNFPNPQFLFQFGYLFKFKL